MWVRGRGLRPWRRIASAVVEVDGDGFEREVKAMLSQVVEEDMRKRPVDSMITVTIEDGCGKGFVDEA